MDKAYLTAGPAIVDMVDRASEMALNRAGLSGTLLYASDKRCVKQLITIVQGLVSTMSTKCS